MKTNWLNKDVSHSFDEYDDYLEKILGYDPLIETILSFTDLDEKILDYGCGGGKVCARLSSSGFLDITGVDISEVMIEKALSQRSEVGIQYFHIDSAKLPTRDNYFRTVIACYVFINIHSLSEFQSICDELYRCLKPGGSIYILDTNPNTTGIQFANFINGEPQRKYKNGDKRKVILKLPYGTNFEIVDTYWSLEHYKNCLSCSGFGNIDVRELTMKDIGDSPLKNDYRFCNEFSYPPFILISAEKNRVR